MRIKHFKLSLALIVGGFLIFGIQTQPTAQQIDPNNPGQGQPNVSNNHGNQAKAKYVIGRFIVKFKSEGPNALTEDAQFLLEGHKGFQGAVSDGSDSLDKLNQKHKVKNARSLFVERHGLTTADAMQKQNNSRQFSKAMHQSRSQRAPQDAAIPDLSNIYVLEVAPESDIETIVQEYQFDPHVEYAQPDYIMETTMVPNDPYYSSVGSWGQNYDDLWGLKKIQAEQAWDITQGEGIIMAVVDTGVDYNHPDIAANIWMNLAEISNNGLDDDSNGFVDDVRGWDFVNSDNDPMDGHGHGTHVSGTIAAVGNNGLGVIGVASKAKIMPVKAISDAGTASISSLSNGIVYAAQNGADVINNSWGCSSVCPSNPIAEDAVRTAYNLGAVVVFAAGNQAVDVSNYSPQNMTSPKPVVVAASTQEDAPTYFTNFGALIDVTAPGGGTVNFSSYSQAERNILSLRAANAADTNSVVNAFYSRQAGTSMSASYTAGVAALVLAYRPTFSSEDVRHVLRISADDLDSPGFDSYTGAGRLNAARALIVSIDVNNVPTDNTVESANSVNVTTGERVDNLLVQAEISSYVEFFYWSPTKDAAGVPSFTGQVGMTIEEIHPTHSGLGSIEFFDTSPKLPLGLTIDANTAIISGTPLAASAPQVYTVWVSSTMGTFTTKINIGVTVNTPDSEQLRVVVTDSGIQAIAAASLFSEGGVLEQIISSFQLTDFARDMSGSPSSPFSCSLAKGDEGFDFYSEVDAGVSQASDTMTVNLGKVKSRVNFNSSFIRSIQWKENGGLSLGAGASLNAPDFYMKGRLNMTNEYDIPCVNLTVSKKCTKLPIIGWICYPADVKNECTPTHVKDVTNFTAGVEGMTFNSSTMIAKAELLSDAEGMQKIKFSLPVHPFFTLERISLSKFAVSEISGTGLTTALATWLLALPGLESEIPAALNQEIAGPFSEAMPKAIEVNMPFIQDRPINISPPTGIVTGPIQPPLMSLKMTDLTTRSSLVPGEYYLRSAASLTLSGSNTACAAAMNVDVPAHTAILDERQYVSNTSHLEAYVSMEMFEKIAVAIVRSGAFCGTITTSGGSFTYKPASMTVRTITPDGNKAILQVAISLIIDGVYNSQPVSQVAGTAWDTEISVESGSSIGYKSTLSAVELAPEVQALLESMLNSSEMSAVTTALGASSPQELGDRLAEVVEDPATKSALYDILGSVRGQAVIDATLEEVIPAIKKGDLQSEITTALSETQNFNLEILKPGNWEGSISIPGIVIDSVVPLVVDSVSGYPQTVDYLKATFKVPLAKKNALAQRYDNAEQCALSTAFNRYPEMGSIGPKSVKEGETLAFRVLAADPDGDSLSYSASGLPSVATFDVSTGNFSWTPTHDGRINKYGVVFAANDGTLSDSEAVTITVNGVNDDNQPPTLSFIGSKSVKEGQILSFSVSAVDPDGDSLTYNVEGLPSGATFDVSAFDASTYVFSWVPTHNQISSYSAVFSVSDGTFWDSEAVTITVDANHAPLLVPVSSPQSVDVGQTLNFTVSASDPDGDPLIYYAEGLPSGASFDASTRVFSWTPDTSQSGNYNVVSFTVSDGNAAFNQSMAVAITVNRVNDLFLSNQTINSGVVQYQAQNSITAGPAFDIESTADVTFKAGNVITLKPGFQAKTGARFRVVPNLN